MGCVLDWSTYLVFSRFGFCFGLSRYVQWIPKLAARGYMLVDVRRI